MDSGCAPQRVRLGHSSDESSDLGADGRAAPSGLARELGPVQTEALLLPAQDGLGRHDHESRSPPRPQPGQADPEEPLAAAQLRPARRPLVHGELLAQGEVLEGELAVAAAEEWDESKQVEQRADHGTAIVSGSEPKDQPLVRPDGVLAKDKAIDAVSDHIEGLIAPLGDAVERLSTIPGVKRRTAEVIVAEIGVDMTRFPNAAHLASWAGLCPGNNESGGKSRPGKIRRGDPWLRTALTEAALGAIRHGRGALAARYRRIMRHRGHEKAVIAVAHAILVAAYHLLTRHTAYLELGDDYYDRRHAERAKRRALSTLERQGYRVTLEAVA